MELPPTLVVEVLSPSTRLVDLERKPRRYLAPIQTVGWMFAFSRKRFVGS